MELQLEKLDDECVDMRNKRLEYWTAPLNQMHSNIHLPEQHKHVDILELRKVRLAENAQASKPAPAHAAMHQHQVLAEEMSTLLQRLSTVTVLGPMLMEFCDKHADRIARQRCAYMRRVANLCKTSEAMEGVAPLLQARLAATDNEFALITESKHKMTHTLPIAIKDQETREKEERMAAGNGPAKAPDKRAGGQDSGPKPGAVLPGRTAGEAAEALAQPLPKMIMQLFLRWSTAQVRMQKRMARFLAKMQWLIYTQRYELLRRSKAILVNPNLTPGAGPAATAHSMAGGSGSGSAMKMPTMVTRMDKVNSILATLRMHFNIEAEMEADNALAFAFEVKTLLNSLHAVQTADVTYPPYDTTLVGASIVVPAASGKGKARLDSSFLKPCPWLADQTLQPEMDRLVTKQRGILSQIKDSELDHVLVADMGAVLEHDLDKVHARVDAQVASHMERALVSPDSEHGTGKAITQPNAPVTSSTHTQLGTLGAAAALPVDRIAPLYHMRLLQARQARRRLLGVLNYLVSIERRLVLDSRGLAFPASSANQNPVQTSGHKGGAPKGGGGARPRESRTSRRSMETR